MKRVSLTKGIVDFQTQFQLVDNIEFYKSSEHFVRNWRWSGEFRSKIGWFMLQENIRNREPYNDLEQLFAIRSVFNNLLITLLPEKYEPFEGTIAELGENHSAASTSLRLSGV